MSVDFELSEDEKDLVEAIRMRNVARAQACLDKGTRPNFIAGYFEERPLHLAAQANCAPIIALLVERGAPVDMTDYQGQTALHHAADKGAEDAARELLKLKANPNHVAHTQRTPIFNAAQQGHAPTITALVEGGADPNIAVNGSTPLFYAVNKSRFEAVRALVQGGARVDARNDRGQTAGDVALAMAGDYEPGRLMAQFLNAAHLQSAVTDGAETKVTVMKSLTFRRDG